MQLILRLTILRRSSSGNFGVIAGHLPPLTYINSKGQYSKYSPSLFYVSSANPSKDAAQDFYGTIVDGKATDVGYDLIPKNKHLMIIATAGVESCYLMNLLIQLGYDPAIMYNVGSFTNGMGNDIAYKHYSEAKHLVEPFELYDTNITYKWENLTPIK